MLIEEVGTVSNDLFSIDYEQLLKSFCQRIAYRQARYERVQHLQQLLLSTELFNYFIEKLAEVGIEYFARIELEQLEHMRLIDVGILAQLLALPFYDPQIHRHKSPWLTAERSSLPSEDHSDKAPVYLHVLDPTIEKYSKFLTMILLQILSHRERVSSVIELLLNNFEHYLSVDEVFRICTDVQILSSDDVQRVCAEIFSNNPTGEEHQWRFTSTCDALLDTDLVLESILDCYNKNRSKYIDDVHLQRSLMLTIFDFILHFNHRSAVSEQLRGLLSSFKPLAIYKAQLLIEKETPIVQLLLKSRQQQRTLTMDDLNRYLEFYPIPCRL